MIATAALILAAFGTGSVLAYVKGADARALAGMQAVDVLVAGKAVPAGTAAGSALQQGLLTIERMPASSVPADAVHAIGADLSSLVLNHPLQPGELLLRPALAAAVQLTSGMVIPPGMVAVTALFCAPEAVAGAVQANSQIAVFDTVVSGASGQMSGQPACSGPHQEAAGVTARTRVVLARVQVLSTGVSAASGQVTAAAGTLSGQSGTGGTMLVTVALSQANAEKLIQIEESGLPYLALLSSSSETKSDIGHLLESHPAASPTPSATATSQRPASVIISQPSGAPVPVIITNPTASPTPSASAKTGKE